MNSPLPSSPSHFRPVRASAVKKAMAVALLAAGAFFWSGAAAFAQDDSYQASEPAPIEAAPQPIPQRNSTVSGGVTGYEVRLSSIENQMRSMNGNLERIEFAVKRLDTAMQRMQGDFDARLTKLETAPPPAPPQAAVPAPAPAQASIPPSSAPPSAVAAAKEKEKEIPAVNGTLGSLNVQGEKVTGGTKNPKSPPLPEKPEDYGLTAQEQYDKAFGLLRQAEYEDAGKAFKRFIDKNPNDKLIESARYWYAETFYVKSKFAEAAVAFADAYQQNPRGGKAPDSLLKLAMSMAALDKVADACTALGELKNKYPNAPATIRARTDQERARLKCGKP